MHKKFVNFCTIDLSIFPKGPILIKSGREGADPTKPDMEFVETYYAGGRAIYLPGSSLKGAIRAHAERIVRTVGGEKRPTQSETGPLLWASNPLEDTNKQNNPNLYLEIWKNEEKKKNSVDRNSNPGAYLYKESCFVSQMFGNTSVASRVRIEDAYPVDPKQVTVEERNGVAIDRVFGSVAVGPFNYQVCTSGEFRTKIHLKNFTLAQLGLIGLVLRDLNDGWFGLGFAKSRGLGTVNIKLNSAVVQYPCCELRGEQIRLLGSNDAQKQWANKSLLGASVFLTNEEAQNYGFVEDQPIQETSSIASKMKLNFGKQETSVELDVGVELHWQGDGETSVTNLFECAVRSWCELLTGAPA